MQENRLVSDNMDNAFEKARAAYGTGAYDDATLEFLFPQLKESEDERIVKDLIGGLMWQRDNIGRLGPHDDNLILPGFCENVGKHLSWLEKQKEQKPINSFDIVPYIDDKIAELQDMWREEKVAFDWDDMHEMIEDVARHFYQKEQKQEWSEEDEKDMAHIIRILDDCYAYGKHDLSKTDHENLVNKLKSLRPSWRPSEEQMDRLFSIVAALRKDYCDDMADFLASLYKQLKAL